MTTETLAWATRVTQGRTWQLEERRQLRPYPVRTWSIPSIERTGWRTDPATRTPWPPSVREVALVDAPPGAVRIYSGRVGGWPEDATHAVIEPADGSPLRVYPILGVDQGGAQIDVSDIAIVAPGDLIYSGCDVLDSRYSESTAGGVTTVRVDGLSGPAPLSSHGGPSSTYGGIEVVDYHARTARDWVTRRDVWDSVGGAVDEVRHWESRASWSRTYTLIGDAEIDAWRRMLYRLAGRLTGVWVALGRPIRITDTDGAGVWSDDVELSPYTDIVVYRTDGTQTYQHATISGRHLTVSSPETVEGIDWLVAARLDHDAVTITYDTPQVARCQLRWVQTGVEPVTYDETAAVLAGVQITATETATDPPPPYDETASVLAGVQIVATEELVDAVEIDAAHVTWAVEVGLTGPAEYELAGDVYEEGASVFAGVQVTGTETLFLPSVYQESAAVLAGVQVSGTETLTTPTVYQESAGVLAGVQVGGTETHWGSEVPNIVAGGSFSFAAAGSHDLSTFGYSASAGYLTVAIVLTEAGVTPTLSGFAVYTSGDLPSVLGIGGKATVFTTTSSVSSTVSLGLTGPSDGLIYLLRYWPGTTIYAHSTASPGGAPSTLQPANVSAPAGQARGLTVFALAASLGGWACTGAAGYDTLHPEFTGAGGTLRARAASMRITSGVGTPITPPTLSGSGAYPVALALVMQRQNPG